MTAQTCKMVLAALGVLALGVCAPRADAQTYHAASDMTSAEVGSRQVGVGDLVADAVRASAHTDAAFVNAAAFSDAPVKLARAGFSAADVVRAVEYKNDSIAVVRLTGAQIRDALENSLYQYPARNGAFLQVSGVTAAFNAGAPAGKRVTNVKIGGSDVQAGKTYQVAMPLPLANGANAYFKYWKKSDIVKDTGVTLESAIRTYLSAHPTIGGSEERLVATGR